MIKDRFFDSLISACKDKAASTPSLYGWEVHIMRRQTYQELLYPRASGVNELYPETVRWPVTEVSYGLTVFVRHGEPLAMGNATASIDPSGDLAAQIDQAIASANSVSNAPWKLVEPMIARQPKIRLLDPRLFKNPGSQANEIRRQVNECFSGHREKLIVNYGELFINAYESRIVTGTGLDMSRESSDIYFEAAAEKIPLPNTQEVHKRTGSLSIRSLDICSFCAELEEEVASLDATVMPDTDSNAVVLVHADTASSILHCLLGQADATREFAKKPFLAPGAKVYKGEIAPDSETLSLSLDQIGRAHV
jgi:hypothetical protein